MNTNVLHDDESESPENGDSGILFEKACGSENIRVIKTGETTAITFGDRGVRNAECVYTFHDQILKLIEQNQCRTLSLDMRGVWFLPSRALGALMSLRKAVEQVELQNVSEELRASLQITQLDHLFQMTRCQNVQRSDAAAKVGESVAIRNGPLENDSTKESSAVRPESVDRMSEPPGDADSLLGRITQISLTKGPEFPQQGCGVISTADGREIYFHAESLANVEFSKLELGREVRFVEVEDVSGRQAIWVWVVSPHIVG